MLKTKMLLDLPASDNIYHEIVITLRGNGVARKNM